MVKCLNCGYENSVGEEVSEDGLGKYIVCEECGSSFDIDAG